MSVDHGPYLPPGTAVRLNASDGTDGAELGIVVHCWLDDAVQAYDCYIAFFGNALPDGPPAERPYVLRYLTTSLTVIERPAEHERASDHAND